MPRRDVDDSSEWILRIGSLPVVAGVLVALNGLYILLVAFGNITDFGTNEPFVRHVLAMDTTNFGAPAGSDLDSDVMWRAITNPNLQKVAYLGIIAWECLAALVLIVATVTWVRERGTTYRRARALSSVGLLMLVLLFMGGFIAIGGEWFQMWKSNEWNGLQPAFQNAVLALIGLIVVHLPSDHWTADARADARTDVRGVSATGSSAGDRDLAS